MARIDASGLDPAVRAAEITVMCDIDNPLCGPYRRQRGVRSPEGRGTGSGCLPDRNLRHLAEVIRRDLGTEILDLPGSDAAGGMGGGMVAFLGGRLQMGIETVLDTVGLIPWYRGATAVLTGGGADRRSEPAGKVVIGVAAGPQRSVFR